MNDQIWKVEADEWVMHKVLECGGKRSATPLSDASASPEKLRRRSALPEQSNTWRRFVVVGLLSSALCLPAFAQFAIDWSKIGGGGGTSTGGVYFVSGTIGQLDGGGPLTGGNYSVTGGFWSLISVVQTPGAPLLTITRSGANVIVSWPSPSAGFLLQQNTNLATTNWTNFVGSVGDDGMTKRATNSPPTGNKYFRLIHF